MELKERLTRTCKRLPVDATKQDRKDLHKIKMNMKKILRDRTTMPSPHSLANISVNHKDYGMSPAEHAAAKMTKNSS